MKALLALEVEPSVVGLLQHTLTEYSLVQATNMEHALKLFIACDRQIDLLLADVTLPEGSGIQVALLLRSVLPALPVILTPRYPVGAWSIRERLDLERLGPDTVTILRKPTPAPLLTKTISELLAQAQRTRTA